MNVLLTDEYSSISMCVIEAIAAATGTDPLSLSPLYDSIDVEALDRLFSSTAPEFVQFDYHGLTIVVRGDGTVTVDGEVHDHR